MSLEILAFIIGTVLGIVGLVVAYFQWKKTKDVERLRRVQLLASINQAKFLVIPNTVVEKVFQKGNPESAETLRQWLWTLHKGTSDNYVAAVYYYLSFEDKFTYDDLEFAKKAGIVSTNWEEQVWRSLIGLREENRKKRVSPSDLTLDRTKATVTLPDSEKQQAEEQ
jgi:hypothetical protein